MSIIGGTQINNNKGDVFNSNGTINSQSNDDIVNSQTNNNKGKVFIPITPSNIKVDMAVYNKFYKMYGVVTNIDWPNVYLDFVGHEDYFFLGQTKRVCRHTDVYILTN